MSQLTRCPACATVFRVTPWQLDARQGFVRCGQCAKVFDARASLVPEARAPDADPARETPFEDELRAEAVVPEAREVTDPESLTVPPEDAPHAAPEVAAASTPAAARGTAAEALPASISESDSAADPGAPSQPLGFGPEHRAGSRRAALLWGVGSLALIAGLAAQAAYWFRTELAVAYPHAKPRLEAACRALGCDIPPPRDATLLSIESSELQVDNNVPGLLTLNATLRNRAPFAQAHPAIELTLTGPDDRPLARRVLAPADYLGERLAREPLFAGASEHAVRLHIDATAVRPTGYRLFLFHP